MKFDSNVAVFDNKLNRVFEAEYDAWGKLTVKNGKIDKYYFDGGYAQATMDESNQSDEFAFFYYTADHLGDIREVIDEKGDVVQITNYYPFGTPYSAEDCATLNPDQQNHKYNGKEFDTMHGLNTYDYGARQYNSLVGRWDRMDPLCEKYYSVSPYAYCLNNPVRMIDKDGRKPGDYFNSADDAALDFGLIYNTYSILQNKEYATYIYVAIDKQGNPYYSYTVPKKGTEDSSSPPTNGAPKNARVKASAHTHADSNKKYGKGNEQFSPTDTYDYANK